MYNSSASAYTFVHVYIKQNNRNNHQADIHGDPFD